MKELEPQLVRIFYNDNWEENWDGPTRLPRELRLVRQGRRARAGDGRDNQHHLPDPRQHHAHGQPERTPEAAMAKFADVLQDLVTTHDLTNVRWVDGRQRAEHAGRSVTLAQYNALYRALHAQLVTRGLREHIKLMGGDLVESSGNPARQPRGLVRSGSPPTWTTSSTPSPSTSTGTTTTPGAWSSGCGTRIAGSNRGDPAGCSGSPRT